MESNLWRLDLPSEELKQDYLRKFLEKLKDNIAKKMGDEAYNIIIPHLQELLTSKPDDLIKLNDKLIKELNTKVKTLSLKDIENAFNYSGLMGKENSYWLAKKIQRNTCVYCNRLYIFTVEDTTENGVVRHLTRPEFDHWFPKSKYPLLSMSLMNLIPSCHICNSSLKGSTIFNTNEYVHPYIHEGVGPQIKFRASRTAGPDSEWTIKLDCGDKEKVQRTMNAFALEEIYANHGSLEVNDIMKFNDAYPQDYINTLFDIILKDSNNKMSKADVYRFFFGTEMEPDNFLDRPLSKMKYDILKDLGWIIDKENTSK